MKSIILFGGNSTIGKYLILKFLNSNFRITIAIRRKSLKEIEYIKQSYIDKINLFVIDDYSDAKIKKIFSSHQKKFKIFPNATFNLIASQGEIGPLWENKTLKWKSTLSTNLVLPFLIIKNSIVMAKKNKKRLSIVMLSGGGAAYARKNFSAYSASKTGLLRIVENTYQELYENKLSNLIQINAIAPGAVNSKMTKEVIVAGHKKAGKKAYDEAIKTIYQKDKVLINIYKLCQFLIDHKTNKNISGKLIHVNEDYLKYIKKIKSINKSEVGLLRRINYV